MLGTFPSIKESIQREESHTPYHNIQYQSFEMGIINSLPELEHISSYFICAYRKCLSGNDCLLKSG